MRKLFLLLGFIITSFMGISQIHIRYNQAGYFPSQEKRIIIMSATDIVGADWTIKNAQGAVVLSNKLAASVQGATAYTTKAFNYIVDFSSLTSQGNFTFTIQTQTVNFAISPNPYDVFAKQVLLGLRARRSASNDAIVHAYSHAGDVSCDIFERVSEDNKQWQKRADNAKADMLGGWYDAGDYIKFTLTTAYTTYFLLKAYENNPSLFADYKVHSTSKFNDLLDEALVGLSFLLKTMPASDIFIIQTGGYKDHLEGLRLPENDELDTKRECYSALSKPQMAYTAAALAIGARIFAAEGETDLANTYRAKAIEIYTAAKASTEASAWFESDEEVFYSDIQANDNLELAAIELYKLTTESSYLAEAKTFSSSAGQAYWYSWGDINAYVQGMLIPEYTTAKSFASGDLQGFMQIRNATQNIWKAPHSSTWGSLYSYFGVANAALGYQKSTSETTYKNMALDVLHYTFGINPWGLAFVASELLPKSITSTYAPLYRLQPSIFPTGEIAEGPTTLEEHTDNKTWFSPAHNNNLWHKEFNSAEFTFFEQAGDYVCMETTIVGLADGLFLMATASGMFNEEPSTTGIENTKEDVDITISQENSHITIATSGFGSESYCVKVYSMQGVVMQSFCGNIGAVSKQFELHTGTYIIELNSHTIRKSITYIVK